jgi:hypothetical protein
MPYALARAFRQERSRPADLNVYASGEVQRSLLTATSRKRWVLALPLTAAAKEAMLQFFLDQGGGMIEFLFYDLFETVPKFSYDPTGAAVAGRYTARFEGRWLSALRTGGLASDASLTLAEIS